MRIGFVNGSPKGINSTSISLLNGLKDYLKSDDSSNNKLDISLEFLELNWNNSKENRKDFIQLLECNAIILAFPLYVDSIPSHLLRQLVSFQKYIKDINKNVKEIKIYTIVNNGFFDGHQNCLALRNIEHFCNRTGFRYMYGIGIGGGGMINEVKKVPFGQGPKKSIGKELEFMSKCIKLGKAKDNIYLEPNFPAFMYKIIVHRIWKSEIKKNGLRKKDLNRKIEI